MGDPRTDLEVHRRIRGAVVKVHEAQQALHAAQEELADALGRLPLPVPVPVGTVDVTVPAASPAGAGPGRHGGCDGPRWLIP